jgi:hypothetical protein
MTTRRSRRRRSIGGALAAATAIVATLALWPQPQGEFLQVVAIDRTDSVTRSDRWAAEVRATVHKVVVDAYRDGAIRVVVHGIGANVADTAKVLDVSLKLPCSNDRRCEEDLARVADQVATLSSRFAATPTPTTGSDIVAGLVSARDLCGSGACNVVVITDLEDSRLADPRDPEQLAAEVAPQLPSFEGIDVTLVGAGADGAPTEAVARAESFFTHLLTASGTTPTIARSL